VLGPGHDANGDAHRVAHSPSQPHPLRLDVGKFFDMAGQGQLCDRMPGVVGVNLKGLADAAPAVAGRFELDRDFSLAAGRDQPRGRGRRAASAGLDPLDL
jgi:hypothetical protein